MRLAVVEEETYCLKSQKHLEYCTGTNHVCYRCGLLIGSCHCAELGSLLDY
ncbi:MAG: hypothetical protein LYZ69_01510 [Nitrososphaerales archaeon]|nr:hypothetical protein [Nitrososphaerales archaeon]